FPLDLDRGTGDALDQGKHAVRFSIGTGSASIDPERSAVTRRTAGTGDRLDLADVRATPCPLPLRPRLARGLAPLAAAVPPRRRRGRAVALARRAREPGGPAQPGTGLPGAGRTGTRCAAPADPAHHRAPGPGNHQAV